MTGDVFEDADEFADLADELLDDDTGFDPDTLYKEARQAWWEETREEVDAATEEIPGYDIETGDGTVEVRGVVHGVSKRVLPAPDDAVDMLNEEIAQKSRDHPVLLEQGFESMLLDEANTYRAGVEELDDQEWAVENDPLDALKWLGKQIAKVPLMYGMVKLAPYVEDRTDSRTWGVNAAMADGLDTVENWDDTLNAMEAYELPTHLADEYKAKEKPVENLLMEGRSIYQAEQAEQHLEDADAVTLYVGIGHVPQIRDYFEDEDCAGLSSTLYEFRH